MRTHQEVADQLRKFLANSGIRQGTVKARIIEQSMLMGMGFADDAYNKPYYQILILSGRSLLDDFPVKA